MSPRDGEHGSSDERAPYLLAMPQLVTPEKVQPFVWVELSEHGMRNAQCAHVESSCGFERIEQSRARTREGLPLVSPDIDSAIGTIVTEIAELEHFFERHQSVHPAHPISGPLDHQTWILFHRKHTTHHLAQFGPQPRERHR